MSYQLPTKLNNLIFKLSNKIKLKNKRKMFKRLPTEFTDEIKFEQTKMFKQLPTELNNLIFEFSDEIKLEQIKRKNEIMRVIDRVGCGLTKFKYLVDMYNFYLDTRVFYNIRIMDNDDDDKNLNKIKQYTDKMGLKKEKDYSDTYSIHFEFRDKDFENNIYDFARDCNIDIDMCYYNEFDYRKYLRNQRLLCPNEIDYKKYLRNQRQLMLDSWSG
tara:strand:+ start:800 stop:1444 length:645 start_codon:yes stop_codon:yes gene_type:complete